MRQYFCGWYYRCQSDTKTLAIIPSIHKTADSAFCNVQIITDRNAFQISFPDSELNKNRSEICIGKNRFGNRVSGRGMDELCQGGGRLLP